jgi:hypothetical protein
MPEQPSAPENAAAASAEEARREFHARFRKVCKKGLDSKATAKLANIFEKTIGCAIQNGEHVWGTDAGLDEWLLCGVAEIADRAQANSGTQVTEPDLTAAANEVICALRIACKRKARREFIGVFCRDYPCVEAEESQARSSGSGTEPDPEMVARAQADFMAHAEGWAPGGFETGARKYLTDKLFAQTVRSAIFNAELNWDTDKPRKEFALRRLTEVVELASLKAGEGSVKRGELHDAACAVISIWQDDCTMKSRFRKVFCESFTFDDSDA